MCVKIHRGIDDMNRNLFLLLTVILLFPGGCTLAPKYTRPEPPVPVDWPTGVAYKELKVSEDAPVASEIKWREFFADDNLRKVIELSLSNNRDLRIAALNIERSRALYQIQRSELFPTADAFGVFSKERIPGILSGAGQPATVKLYNLNLGVSAWELDFFGRIRSLSAQALELYLATEHARNSFQIALVADVANVFLAFAADSERLKLAQDTFTAQQASYDLILSRYTEGISSEIDLRQAQTRVDAARVDIAIFTSLVAQDENLLNLLVGSSVPRELLANSLQAIAQMRDIIAAVPSEVLQQRPDILAAENQLKAANANIGAARAAFFPRISLTTSTGTTSDKLAGLFEAGSKTWLFAPQVNLPIFDAGRRKANLKVAKADRDIFLARYERTIQLAFREVADALAERGTLDDQLAAQQSLVDAAAVSYRLSETRYLKGIDNYLIVLDSQRSLYNAQQGLINVRQAKLANLLTLYRVLGGGAENLEESGTSNEPD